MKKPEQTWEEYLQQMFHQWNIKKTRTDYVNARGAYRELCTAIRVAPDDEALVHVALVYFTPLCLASAKAGQGLYLNMVNDTLMFLSRKSSTDLIRNQAHGDTALAWFCCSHAVTYLYNQQSHSPELRQLRNEFVAVLNNWTGVPLPANTLPVLEIVMGHLYGPACWNLYAHDIGPSSNNKHIASLVYEVTHANLPFVFRNDKGHDVCETSSTALPDDLSLWR